MNNIFYKKTFNNLIGKKYGDQLVVSFEGRSKKGHFIWKIKCDCGREKIKVGYDLKKHKTCGDCDKKYMINIRGKRFDRLLVLDRDYSCKKFVKWICQCDCGNIKSFYSSNLLSHKTTSCGCKVIERCKNMRGSLNPNFKNYSSNQKIQNKRDFLYKRWCRKIKKLGGNTCVKCKSKKRIEAHHIISWQSNIALRYDLNNGICLCRSCHILFHSKYGKQQKSAENFKLFIKS